MAVITILVVRGDGSADSEETISLPDDEAIAAVKSYSPSGTGTGARPGRPVMPLGASTPSPPANAAAALKPVLLNHIRQAVRAVPSKGVTAAAQALTAAQAAQAARVAKIL
jgi:hypothetical protein